MSSQAEWRSDFQKDTNLYLRALPAAMDSKISVLCAATIGSLLFILNFSKDLVWTGSHWDIPQALLFVTLLGAWGGCGYAVISSLAALWARTSGSSAGVRSFIGILSSGSAEKYAARIAALDDSTAALDISRHNFELATIALQKIRWVNRAVGGLAVGLVFAGASVALLNLSR